MEKNIESTEETIQEDNQNSDTINNNIEIFNNRKDKSYFSFDPLAAKASLNQPPSVILPFLYIGTQCNASDKFIKQFNIQRILNLKDTHYSESPKGVKFLHVPMSDYGDSEVLIIAKQCFSFIESARKNNENILVHCRGGLNRSPTIVIAYLMIKRKMSLGDAYNLVKSKREKISPHKKYIEQLKSYEIKTRGVDTLVEEHTPTLQDRIEQYRKDHINVNKTNSHPIILESIPNNFPPKLEKENKSKTTPIEISKKKKKDKSKKK